MIVLDFSLSPDWTQQSQSFEKDHHIDEFDLRYRYVLGDIVFTIGNADFSAPWGWIPLLDFSYSMSCIVDDLMSGGLEACVEFTESDAKLLFRREEKKFQIMSNYAPGEALVSLQELHDAVRQFNERLGKEVEIYFPFLAQNRAFQKLASACCGYQKSKSLGNN